MISFGWAAFWIALAAVIVSGRWLRARREALKYDTIVRLAEKTGRIDEEQFKMLFPPPHPLPPHWFAPPPPNARRVLRVFGTILLSLAVGLALCFLYLREFGTSLAAQQTAVNGFASAIVLAFIGLGLFIASGLVAAARDDREAR